MARLAKLPIENQERIYAALENALDALTAELDAEFAALEAGELAEQGRFRGPRERDDMDPYEEGSSWDGRI